MFIKSLRIDGVLLDPSNARQHSIKNLDAIKASLKKFGQQKPIVVNSNNIVIAGNGTLIAAKELGWTEIKAVQTELGNVEQTAFAIADNRTTDLSSWDFDVLGDTLQSLREDDWNLDDLGFSEIDCDDLFSEPIEPEKISSDDIDSLMDDDARLLAIPTELRPAFLVILKKIGSNPWQEVLRILKDEGSFN